VFAATHRAEMPTASQRPSELQRQSPAQHQAELFSGLPPNPFLMDRAHAVASAGQHTWPPSQPVRVMSTPICFLTPPPPWFMLAGSDALAISYTVGVGEGVLHVDMLASPKAGVAVRQGWDTSFQAGYHQV